MRDTSNACLQSWLHKILFKSIQLNIQLMSMTEGHRYAIENNETA